MENADTVRGTLLGLYWSARKSTIDTCAADCLRTLQLMSEAGFHGLYKKGRTRDQALAQPVEMSLNSIRKLLEEGVNRREVGREAIAELGWSLSLWSGGLDGESFQVSIQCASFSKSVGNCVVIHLPPHGPHSFENIGQTISHLFDALIDVWEPQQAIICARGALLWDDKGDIAVDVEAHRMYRAAL